MIKIVETRNGRMMVDTRDQFIAGSFVALGEYNHAESMAVSSYCEEGTIAFDIGANIGDLTMDMSQAVGPEGCVIACEPQGVVYQLLVGNVALNQAYNIVPLRVAVGKEPGSIVVPDTLLTQEKQINTGGLELGEQVEGCKVSVVTIDQIAPKDKRVSMIKIDVEGMEPDVILGALETIKKWQPVIYLEIDRPNYEKSLALLMTLGYRCYDHQPPLFREANFAKCVENPFGGNVVSMNCIAIHGDGEAPTFEHCYGEIRKEKKNNG